MLEQMGKQAKDAAFILAQLTTAEKNCALSIIAEQLEQQAPLILDENAKDIELAKQNGLSDALIDRLLLTQERLQGIANDVRHVISLADPVGKIIDGGKETQFSNKILIEVVQNALEQAGLPKFAVQAITDPNRELVMQLLKLDRYVDMIIPRGGAGLHELCKQHSTIPVIVGGVGVCHTFVEESADQNKAVFVIDNAKTQRPSTCNTLETLLVQDSIAEEFLPKLVSHLVTKNVKYHAKSTALNILKQAGANVCKVTEKELRKEWGSLDLNVVVVEDIHAAIEHIRQYGTQHSESILTSSQNLARQFINQVDAAAVYVNASTRFTDGGQFGLGSEVAVSTQKLHARGPMGLEALTSYKWVCEGEYTVRK
ncbi:gamma-glutamyl-phosphate reductase [Haemophilus influenzae biotype aegyptius]|uniref:glutamate-5-semialdehyde dehydrogenase n=1 Tax=Haemophilus influenzae TaxID=727 RepID=UPI0001F367C4|nr:glutamate-5-semialdehyde dehydrogenase [Haemophilus influenzae]QEQ61505.1 glutamate-5-semialdehyde dehydrogenase [Haemophilus influenzae biotype aegyptius]QEQ62996.1 glutamate-5-semialdehyde dehydrogenase [Haemophilus influenzae biotype aegyptius]QEQ65064.1 glutamate-5-semialdehyde dehydrogenase [Haemophilus influenzae biotype aegyptius]TMQ36130.1 gamma-glutamyl-phosphate reductase [Haemophilus influenzae biotype aegyptius]TMQ36146.1 gamma-glutamyl-phosphate reductase [Haemophilus influenza